MSNDKKPDFSNVRSRSGSTEQGRPDFSNVRSGADSTEAITGGPGARTYTVARGDTLSQIARDHYGNASQWRAIFAANRDQIDDPDRIFPGQVLKIPAPDQPRDGASG